MSQQEVGYKEIMCGNQEIHILVSALPQNGNFRQALSFLTGSFVSECSVRELDLLS